MLAQSERITYDAIASGGENHHKNREAQRGSYHVVMSTYRATGAYSATKH